MMSIAQVALKLVVAFCVYLIGKKSIKTLVNKISLEKSVSVNRAHYIRNVLIFVWGTIVVVCTGFVIGIGYREVGLFFGSVFALIGVALFAQWSILSNVTASVIVFFFFPYKVGDHVKIIDGENSIEGLIKEISLFHVILLDREKSLVTYPNAMVFQKAVKIRSAEQVKGDQNG